MSGQSLFLALCPDLPAVCTLLQLWSLVALALPVISSLPCLTSRSRSVWKHHERARKVGKTDAGVKCLKVEANTGRKEKEGFEHKGVTHVRNRFFYEVENVPSTDYEMVTHLAHDFPPIHYDLNVTM